MKEIKIGDKVFVKDYVLNKQHITTNETLRVTDISISRCLKTILYTLNGEFYVLETDIISVNPTFTKNDIKPNMLVKLANGLLFDVVMFEHGLELVSPTLPTYVSKIYFNLDDFNQNMEFSQTSANHHDIVAVYGYCKERYDIIAESYDLTNRPLLWSRATFGEVDTPEYEPNIDAKQPKSTTKTKRIQQDLERAISELEKQKPPVQQPKEFTIEC